MQPTRDDELRLMRIHLERGTPYGSDADAKAFQQKAMAQPKFAHELAEMNEKRAMRVYEKWTSRGWFEYGVSLRTGWLTPEGVRGIREHLATQEAKARRPAEA